MPQAGPSVLFVGDLADPWVNALASVLPPSTPRLDCPDFLPESWPSAALGACVVVLHRGILSNTDAARLHALRNRPSGPPRVVLCVGPHARYFQVECWRPLVDAILPEATALDILARHAAPPDTFAPERDTLRNRPRIVVVSSNFELRLTLSDACQRAGYPAQPVPGWADAPPDWPSVWDVPVLEPDWPEILAREAASRPVLALLPFADRETVSLARSQGASACLDLPLDPADLAFVLDRINATQPGSKIALDPAHRIPPAPLGLGRARSPISPETRATARE